MIQTLKKEKVKINAPAMPLLLKYQVTPSSEEPRT